MRSGLSKYLMVSPGVFLTLFFLFVPILVILVVSSYTFTGTSMGPPLTFENYIKILTSPIYLTSLLITLRLGFIVTAICIVLGYPVAYFMAMYVKGNETKLLIVLLLLMPWWIDYTIRSMGWLPILGTEGAINMILMTLGILKGPSDAFIFNEFSATMVMAQGNLLFMVGPIFFSLGKIERNILEAAETLGASRVKAFYQVIFKMSKPGIIIGSIFVFVSSMADYATPRLIGGMMIPIGLNIVNQIAVLNWPLASAISIFLVTISLVLIIIMLKIVDIKQMIF